MKATQTTIITRTELFQLIAGLHSLGTSNVNIHTRTDARLKRKGVVATEEETEEEPEVIPNPFPKGGVLKVAAFNVAFGANYGKMVNRKLAKAGKEANFVPEGNWFQSHDGLNTVVENKKDPSKLYARIPVNTKNKPVVAFETPDGKPVAREEVAPFIPAKAPSRKQKEAGLDEGEQVTFRVVAMENVLGVTYGGTTYLCPQEA